MTGLSALFQQAPLVLSITFALVIGLLLIVAWRAPLLVTLGLRNVGRRRVRAVLIVCGLMLSTLVIGSALGTGDTIAHTLRTLVTGSLGTVDEVVIRNPPRGRLRQQVQAVIEPGFGGLAAAGLDFFAQSDVDRLQATQSRAIAALAPAIVDRVTVVSSANQRLQSALTLLAVGSALPNKAQSAFGQVVSADGTPIALDRLGPSEVVLNVAAAEALGVHAGDALTTIRAELSREVQIRAISANGGLGGTQPLILVPLTQYQQTIGRVGQINLVLVANQGGVAGVTRSAEAARDLRGALANQAVAQQLQAILAQPNMQRGLHEIAGLAEGRERERLVALAEAAIQPERMDEFVSLITEPRIRTRLLTVAWRLPAAVGTQNAAQLLREVTDLSVLEIKQETLDQANEYGAMIATVFLVLSIFSVVAAMLLIGLIWTLLAADRGAELATMRAMGMRRAQIMGLFLWEGVLYTLLGAALGTLFSVVASYGIVAALEQALTEVGIQLDPYVAPRSLLIAFASGALLTFATMFLAAWRVSHAGIVAGGRGEIVDEAQRGRVVAGFVLLVIAGGVWWRWGMLTGHHPLISPLALSLAFLGATLSCQALLSNRNARRETVVRWLAVIAGGSIASIWLRVLLRLHEISSDVRQGALLLAGAGVIVLIALVWTAVQAIGSLLKLIDWSLMFVPRFRAVVRPAAGYLGQQRGRTAMTVVLFGMVMCVMVAALTVIDVVVRAYGGSEPPVAGFDLRADIRAGATINDLPAALEGAPAVGRTTFGAIGGVAMQETTAIQLGVPRAQWHDVPLAMVDDHFLEGIQAHLQSRAGKYSSDRAAWAALRDHPGTAVISGRIPMGFVIPAVQDDSALAPFTIWLRPQTGGAPVKLSVIGVVDARSELDPAIYVSTTTAEQLSVPVLPPRTYFFSVREGVRIRDAAQGLQVSFGEQGLVVTTLGEVARMIQAVRLLLVQIVQGFLGLGLFAGIAALGLLGVQAVVERRQQLGTLRALGFTTWHLRGSLLIESIIVSVFGIGTGTAAGVVVAGSLVALLALRFPELSFAVPWSQIAVTIAIAWAGSTVALLLAAWQAGRIAPAEALRQA